jgi:SIR2-like domain
VRFDAIFTLNQDTLLEQKYIPFVGPPKWGRAHLPGIKYLGNPQITGSVHDRMAVMEPNPSDFRLTVGVQPYIKLHGSCNWNDGPSGGRILIMGGQKAVSINQFPILSWYHQEFRNMLMRPGARLMVIGYSFSDAHINDAIMDAIKQSDLKIFLVDPSGDKILDKRNPRATIPDHPGPLLETIPPRIIGMSQRSIDSTFNNDTVEHGNLTRFFG